MTKEQKLLQEYENIRKAQIDIKGEVKMESVTRLALDSTRKRIIQNYQDLLFKYKEYYTRLLSVFLYSQDQSKNLLNDLKFEMKTTQDKLTFDPVKAQTIFNDPNNATMQKKMDIFTFSIIPSNYNFFLSETSINNFFNDYLFAFIGDKKEVFYKLARVIFFHPRFIEFCTYVFSPLITLDEITKDNLKKMIKYNINKCPIQVRKMLDMAKSKEMKTNEIVAIIENSFLQPLKGKNIQLPLSGFIDFYEYNNFKPDELVNKLNNEILTCFVNILLGDDNEEEDEEKEKIVETSFLNPPITNEESVPEIIKMSVYSKFDLNFTTNNGTFNKFFTTTLKNYISDRTTIYSVSVTIKSTKNEGTLVGAGKSTHLRHLLKYSDILPLKPPEYMLKENISINQILKELCVKRGPLSTLQSRYNDYDALKGIDKFDEYLKNVTVKRTGPLRSLSRLENTNQNIDHEKNHVQIQINNVTSLTKFINEPQRIPTIDDKEVREQIKKHLIKNEAQQNDPAFLNHVEQQIQQYTKIYDKLISDETYRNLYIKSISNNENPFKMYKMPDCYVRAFGKAANLYKMMHFLHMIFLNEIFEQPEVRGGDKLCFQLLPLFNKDINDLYYRILFLTKFLDSDHIPEYFLQQDMKTQELLQILNHTLQISAFVPFN